MSKRPRPTIDDEEDDATPVVPVRVPRHPLATGPKPPRRPTPMDRIRVEAYAKLLNEGVDPLDAGWTVLSDPRSGIARWRGCSARPRDTIILSKIAALIRRTSPDLAEDARAEIVARLAGFRSHAVAAVRDVTRGRFGDAQTARARLSGAELILRSLGVADRNGPSTNNVQINVAVGLAQKLRAASAGDD